MACSHDVAHLVALARGHCSADIHRTYCSLGIYRIDRGIPGTATRGAVRPSDQHPHGVAGAMDLYGHDLRLYPIYSRVVPPDHTH